MIAEFGARYVIVGHSERRTLFGDTDAIVVEGKYGRVEGAGLSADLLRRRNIARENAKAGNRNKSVLARQVDALHRGSGAQQLEGGVVTYEPVWAIGTGKTSDVDLLAGPGCTRFHPAPRSRRRMRRWRRSSRSCTGAA